MVELADVWLGHLQRFVLRELLIVAQLRQVLSESVKRLVQVLHAFSFASVCGQTTLLPDGRRARPWIPWVSAAVIHRQIYLLDHSLKNCAPAYSRVSTNRSLALFIATNTRLTVNHDEISILYSSSRFFVIKLFRRRENMRIWKASLRTLAICIRKSAKNGQFCDGMFARNWSSCIMDKDLPTSNTHFDENCNRLYRDTNRSNHFSRPSDAGVQLHCFTCPFLPANERRRKNANGDTERISTECIRMTKVKQRIDCGNFICRRH